MSEPVADLCVDCEKEGRVRIALVVLTPNDGTEVPVCRDHYRQRFNRAIDRQDLEGP